MIKNKSVKLQYEDIGLYKIRHEKVTCKVNANINTVHNNPYLACSLIYHYNTTDLGMPAYIGRSSKLP